MKWRIILMITFCIIVYGALFSGCTEATEREIIDDATNTESVLVICSEQDYKPDIDIIITDFETQTGQKIDVKYIPPTYSLEGTPESALEKRNSVIQQIKTEMMAGEGPDLFLMPSYGSPSELFPDALKTISSGVFADLSRYNEEFNISQQILHAGQYQERQYIIPLGVRVPAFITSKELTNEISFCYDDAMKNTETFLNELLLHPPLDGSCEIYSLFSILPLLSDDIMVDVENLTVNLHTRYLETILAYERSLYCEYRDSNEGIFASPSAEKIYDGSRSFAFGMLGMTDMQFAVHDLLTSTVDDFIVSLFPNENGTTTAIVSGYAAVSANSVQTDAAINFIRFALQPKYQNAFVGTGASNFAGLPVNCGSIADYLMHNPRDIATEVKNTELYQKLKKVQADVSQNISTARIPTINESLWSTAVIDNFASDKLMNEALAKLEQEFSLYNAE